MSEEIISITAIEKIAERVYDRREAEKPHAEPSSEVKEIREKLALINAKEYITLNEAAFLLSCSPSYLRKLVGLARKGSRDKGQIKNPIPYRDLAGLVSFHREELLLWARPPHLKLVTDEAERRKI